MVTDRSRTGTKSNSTYTATTITADSSNGVVRAHNTEEASLLLRADRACKERPCHARSAVRPLRPSCRPGFVARARLAPPHPRLYLFSKRARHPRYLTDELVSDRIRSLLRDALVDVVSSDQHPVRLLGLTERSTLRRECATCGRRPSGLEGGRPDYLPWPPRGHARLWRTNIPSVCLLEPAATSPITSIRLDHAARLEPALTGRERDGLFGCLWSERSRLREFAAHFTSSNLNTDVTRVSGDMML